MSSAEGQQTPIIELGDAGVDASNVAAGVGPGLSLVGTESDDCSASAVTGKKDLAVGGSENRLYYVSTGVAVGEDEAWVRLGNAVVFRFTQYNCQASIAHAKAIEMVDSAFAVIEEGGSVVVSVGAVPEG